MKKLFWLLSAILLVSCRSFVGTDNAENKNFPEISSEKYQFVVLGDLHYDNQKYHTEALKIKRAGEFRRNRRHWKAAAPAIVAAAANKVNAETIFAFQCGDITQGDADSQESQIALFKEALDAVTPAFLATGHPFFVVKGNHDFRSPGAGKAFAETVVPFISEQLPKNSWQSGANYAFRHGNDLFVFVDCELPDENFLINTINSCKDIRHLFVFDHLPLFPYGAAGSQWTLFGYLKDIRIPFTKVLAEHNAIMIAAHVHNNSLTHYSKPEDGSIVQATISSMESVNDDFPPLTDVYSKDELAKAKGAQKEFHDEFIPFISSYKRTSDSGYAVIRVEGDNVFLDMYHSANTEPSFTWKLK